MAPFSMRRGRLDWRPALLGLTVVLAVGVLSKPAVAADPVSTIIPAVTVNIDQAKIVKMPASTSTLVVGNPLIADVSVQPGGLPDSPGAC